MAQWRKVVVSGSSPEFNDVTLSGDLTVTGGDITLGSTSIFSGGDTTSLNNIDAIDATTESTIEAAIDTLSNLVTTGTLNSGAISSGFGNIDIGTSTLNAGNTTLDTITNDSAVASSHITGSFTGSFVGDGTNIDLSSNTTIGSEMFKTISVSGQSDIVADTNADTLTFANGDGIAITTNAGTDTITVATSAIPNTSLANSTISGVALGSNLNDLTVDDTTIQLNSGTTFNGSAARTISAKTAAIADGGGALATADQIHTFYTAGGSNLATALNTDLGGNFTIGNQSDDTATFTGGVVVNGDLDVNGSLTTIDSTNLKVADRFIIAASGSSSGDGGLIVETSGAGSGSAFAWDDSANRWSLSAADGTGEGDTTIATKQYIVSVSGSAADASGNPSDFGNGSANRIGMMHVNTSTGDIFIYS
mgnify:CR=1 FL=1